MVAERKEEQIKADPSPALRDQDDREKDAAVIVEVKALDRLRGVEEAQIINYLKAAEKEVGLPSDALA